MEESEPRDFKWREMIQDLVEQTIDAIESQNYPETSVYEYVFKIVKRLVGRKVYVQWLEGWGKEPDQYSLARIETLESFYTDRMMAIVAEHLAVYYRDEVKKGRERLRRLEQLHKEGQI